MKIANSSIAMFSSRTYSETYERSESLRVWVGSRSPRSPQSLMGARNASAQAALPSAPDTVDISAQAKAAGSVEGSGSPEDLLSEEDKLKVSLIERLIEMMTGKKIKIKVTCLSEECQDKNSAGPQNSSPGSGPAGRPQEGNQGWGMVYESHEKYQETEATSFSAAGVINTTDGREIAFSVDLAMSRSFMQEQNISIRAGDAEKIDPLVINFSGAAAELTNTKFSFDLDTDGANDQISFVRPGSGFLALDRNNDGVINNGGELFGPETGNGFLELAVYDEDGSGWIDESDSVFEKLRIWTKDGDGKDTLFALGEKGIGAVYLGNIETLFAVKNQSNETLGQVSKTGLFVKENGTVGTVQQINLTI
ncbi:hypothetical protein [Phosphitispora fastidiosa]|uniref:hypothetical protein n=1 Tax=Phosphitispora fastidiosa TaxID=2837202 RepID=UPI001E5E1ED0|nr:hypothetical protein [Phosphitispora fastidiosa]MBU7006767.1 hypothetical protein [Phosphitispora fastidiosa]